MANTIPDHPTKFKPGESGNPGGKTSAHRKAEIEAAELAAETRLKLVAAFANLVKGKATDSEKYDLMNSDALRLLKESEDRGYGSPKQTIESDVTTREAPKGLSEFYAATGGTTQRDDDG